MKGIIKKIEIQDCKDRYGASNRISGDQIGKSLICQEGKSVTSHWGLAVLFRFSSTQNPRLGLESLKVPQLASYIVSGTKEKQGHCQVCIRLS